MRPRAEARLRPLDDIARGMARDIRPLYAHATPERYRGYLRRMYHYTLNSGAELRYAASISPGADAAAMFLALAGEEEHHHRLAQADLAALGHPDVGATPASVVAFRGFWNGTSRGQAAALLGALYALENVARFARRDALACLAALGLRPYQTRFVTVHLVADDAHASAVAKVCRGHLPGAAEVLLSGARTAGRLWVAMHLDRAGDRG